ncbi:hypothetical protein PR048_029512 [Dryococelus australis]|uniref:Uncharacterized protein n=1 Tax=Dryococelus australis TaxID=614101 RepID=A0ABQ9GDL5_9NEOP|nr:hypothetical protein PR048_029512 [Dryococelus australis]
MEGFQGRKEQRTGSKWSEERKKIHSEKMKEYWRKKNEQQSLLASHQSELCSIRRWVAPGFSQVGIVPDDAAGLQVFLGGLPFLPPFLSGATPYSPQSPSSALKTSMLRAVHISSTIEYWVMVREVKVSAEMCMTNVRSRQSLGVGVLEAQSRLKVSFMKRRNSDLATMISMFKSPQGARGMAEFTLRYRRHALDNPRVCNKTCKGAAVAERLDCPLPTEANRAQSPAGSLPGFSQVGNHAGRCRQSGGFSRGSPVSTRLSIPTSLRLVVKSCPNLSIQLELNKPAIKQGLNLACYRRALLACHHDKPGSIPRFSHVGIVPVRCRWSAGFPPPLHSEAAPSYSANPYRLSTSRLMKRVSWWLDWKSGEIRAALKSGMNRRGNPASKVKKRGSVTGDTNTHA